VNSPRIADARGRTLLAPSLPPGEPGLDRLMMIRRSELFDVLLDAVARNGQITTYLGAEVVGASRDGRLRIRREGVEEERAFDLVIGADGVKSKIRGSGEFGTVVRSTGVHYLRGLTRAEAAREEEAWTPAGIFGSFGVREGTYFFCSAASPAVAEALRNRDLGALRAAWEVAYPASAAILAGVGSFDDLLINEVIEVRCRSFVDGRLVLLGDAAHAMSPNLGQGANSALVDAAALVDELRRGEFAAALAAYDRRRRPAVTKVQDAAAAAAAISERTGLVFRWLRDRVLLPMAALGMEKRARAALQEEPAALRAIASLRAA
jgi:2-polyprenyl-6-methoxyphenol hydroxylase-like FAD-dependent oxidoreductase